jgi:hypothetical protein
MDYWIAMGFDGESMENPCNFVVSRSAKNSQNSQNRNGVEDERLREITICSSSSPVWPVWVHEAPLGQRRSSLLG